MISKLKDALGLDKRSLAFFRIGLSLCIIGDLIERATDLSAHYTDAGFVPRELIAEKYTNLNSLNFHSVSGLFVYQAAIFLFNGFLALCLLVGYKTKLMTFLCWMLLISLQSHNPFLNHGGDLYFRLLLFYALLLPLGSCFSVDSALKNCEKPRKKLTSPRLVSAGTFALLVQISVMYFTSVQHKSAPEWRSEYTATWYALQLDYFATPFAAYLSQFPELLKLLTWAVLKWENWGAFLFFVPFYHDFCRSLGVLGFLAMHFGFVLCLRLGLFFYVCSVAVFALIPSSPWDILLSRLRTVERKSFAVYYHENSRFSKRLAHILQTFLLIPGTGLSNFENLSEGGVFTELYTSKIDEIWLVAEDIRGTRYKNEKAVRAVFAHSPLAWPFTPLAAPLSRLLSLLHSRSLPFPEKENVRHATGYRKRKFFGPRAKRVGKIASSVLVLFLAVYVISWNMGNIGVQYHFPPSMNAIGWLLHIDQSWGMFSPHPPKAHWWYVIEAESDKGVVFELFRDSGLFRWEGNTPFSFDKADPFHESFGNHRWFKYFENGYNNRNRMDLRLHFGKWVCRQYNARHLGVDRLYHFKVHFVIEDQPLEAPRENQRSEVLWEHICYEKTQAV